MSENATLVYCQPGFMIPFKDFYKDIKITVKSTGYEMIENKDNLLLCVEFIGKLQVNSSTRTKLDLNKNLEFFGSRGISVLKAKKVDMLKLEEIEWDVSNILGDTNTRDPTEFNMYTHYNGDQAERFSVYKPSREKQYEDDLEE